MTTILPLCVDVCIPRVAYDGWGGQRGTETVLRVIGLLPPAAQEVRWRMDVVNAGYIVSYSVPVSLESEEGS